MFQVALVLLIVAIAAFGLAPELIRMKAPDIRSQSALKTLKAIQGAGERACNPSCPDGPLAIPATIRLPGSGGTFGSLSWRGVVVSWWAPSPGGSAAPLLNADNPDFDDGVRGVVGIYSARTATIAAPAVVTNLFTAPAAAFPFPVSAGAPDGAVVLLSRRLDP